MAAESIYLTRFFDFLNKREIKYCVMNNYHDYPEIIPSDIDIAIELSTFQQLDDLISEYSKDESLPVVQKIWHGYHKCAYILSPASVEERFRLQLDFFVDFTAKGYYTLITAEEMICSARPLKNFFVPSPEIEAAFLLMRRVIKNDATKEKFTEIYGLFVMDGVAEKVGVAFGDEFSLLMSSILAIKDLNELRKTNAIFSKLLKKFSLSRTSLSYRLRYRVSNMFRLVHRAKHPIGLSVCFLSPDGGGKSTVQKHVAELVAGAFHGEKYLYWRPGVLPPPGMLNIWNPSRPIDTNPHPHAHPPQNQFKSFVRFFYYFLDYLFGYPLKIYPLKIRKNIVFFDRYYFDFLVDLHRYKMTLPRFVPKFLLPLVPSPDLVVVLRSPVEVMHARKQELPREELLRQNEEYLKLSRHLRSCHVIDGNRPIADVAKEIAELVLKRKIRSTSRAMAVRS